MSTTKQRRHLLLAPLAAAVAALALSACGKKEEQTVGQQLDTTVAQAERKAEEFKAEAKQAGAEARQTADGVADKVKDAAITTAVKAELTRDIGMAALDINVDTDAGRVALRGSAPDAAARERAQTLAAGVDGVVAVDNQLLIATR
jgi:hyperosmotically inducible protein